MKRLAAVLALAGALAIGISSSASAATGDPLHVKVCTSSILGCATLADVSVRQTLPGVAILLACDPQQGTHIPLDVPISIPPPLQGSLGIHTDIDVCQQ
jgi:hypothetical protein